MKKSIVILAAVLITAGCQRNVCEFTIAVPFQDGMVLPKNKEIKVFGTGEGTVRVDLAGSTAKCRAVGGRWCATLPAMEAGGPYVMKVRNKSSRREIGGVYVGTVLLLGGQSNMQFKLRQSSTPPEEIKGDSLLRSFSLPRIEKGEPFTPSDGWVECTDGNAGDFSAIGYLVGSELRCRTGEAVGLVNCYQGASIIEAWIPAGRLEKPEYKLPDDQLHKDHFLEQYRVWNRNGVLYEHDIVPFAPYQVSGTVWYQGESNTGSGEYVIYPALFSEMADAWREAFQDGTLPFVIVEIADYVRGSAAWPLLQKAQETIPGTVPNTVVVKSADVCDSLNIHPADKRALSLRIAHAVMEL